MAHSQKVYLFIASSFSSLIFSYFISSPLTQAEWIPSDTEGSSTTPLCSGCDSCAGTGPAFQWSFWVPSPQFRIFYDSMNPWFFPVFLEKGRDQHSWCPTCLEKQGSSLPKSPGAGGDQNLWEGFQAVKDCTELHWSEITHPGFICRVSVSNPAAQSSSTPTHPPCVPLPSPGSCHHQPFLHTSWRLLSSSSDQTRLLLRSQKSRQPQGHEAGSTKHRLPFLQVWNVLTVVEGCFFFNLTCQQHRSKGIQITLLNPPFTLVWEFLFPPSYWSLWIT